MRCHYLSDLHLESQGFDWRLPKGDILIVAGDLCHARCLDPGRPDKYSIDQRTRVMRFIDSALANFAHVLLVAGNHDHYDGVFDETTDLLQRHLPGVTVLDNEHVEIEGVRFFGTTLWSDFEGRSDACMNAVRRRCGEFFFVKKRTLDSEGRESLAKFRPQDALQAFDASLMALKQSASSASGKTTVVISHHAPSLQGMNPQFVGNGMDGAYASDLDRTIESMERVPVWVHGHTHIMRTYR
ncbi:MAG: metallophosphoesterase, partial [Hyphomicrobium sp.]